MTSNPSFSELRPRKLPLLTGSIAANGHYNSVLSPAEVQRYRNDGFLVMPDFCDSGQVSTIRAILLNLFEQHAGRDEGNEFDMLSLDLKARDAIQPQIIKPSLYAAALLRTPHFMHVQAIARQLLGADARFSFDHTILKPAGTASATPWHQDEAHSHDPYFHHNQISFWMPLQDVSEDNGCMRYIPESHSGPLLPHRSFHDDPRMHAIECPSTYFDESAAIAQPVTAGSCILHDGRTLHGASPNCSNNMRLAYVLAFRGPPIARSEPVHFNWLQPQQTASSARNRHWRRRGGYVVLLLRWLRRAVHADLRSLSSKWKALLNLRLARMRSKQGTTGVDNP